MRFLTFWGRALVTGGKLAIALGSVVALVIGGSAIAYFEAAHHRSLWVVIGAAVVILVCMWAAYRRWDDADRDAVLLRERLSQTAIHPDHAAQLGAVFDSCRRAIANLAPCDYLDEQFRAAFRAHYPDLIAPLEQWDATARRLEVARTVLADSVRQATPAHGFAAPTWNEDVIAAFIAGDVDWRAVHRDDARPHGPIAFRCVQDLPNGGWSAQLNTNRGGERAREFESSHVPEVAEDDARLTAFFEEVDTGQHAADVTAGVVALGALRPTLLQMLNAYGAVPLPIRPDECPVCALHLDIGVV